MKNRLLFSFLTLLLLVTIPMVVLALVSRVSLYGPATHYGPYLPLIVILLVGIHFARRKVWTGEAPH